MNKEISIYWFRQDLRLTDNPALSAAVENGQVIPIYILDDTNAKQFKIGDASRCWLHHSLNSLNQSLDKKLSVYSGDAIKIIQKLIKLYKVKFIYWNRCYEPWQIERDKKIKQWLEKNNIDAQSFNSSLLWEPWEILKADNTPYRVFTPFYRKACASSLLPRKPVRKVNSSHFIKDPKNQTSIDDLQLLPTLNWDKKIMQHWQAGEKQALSCLDDFLETKVDDYRKGRDFPAKQSTSRLSPHLHFGEISPHQIWAVVKNIKPNDNNEHFLRELIWREFSYYLIYHFPKLPVENFQKKFDQFPWLKNKKLLSKWQQGQTGYPIIDAGMRELWQTGYMHNRVRMIVASFLVKNLLLHWHHGEAWFWDCLVDADLASNSASWQWVAGSGADAAPYFRIFNPVTQAEKFDPDGEYILKYVPELNGLEKKYLAKPWQAPESNLQQAGIKLGKTYPKPIIDLKISRELALAAFRTLK